MSIFYYKGEDGAFHPLHALVGPPGKDGVISQIETESGEKFTSLPTLKFLNCEVTADTEKVTVSPRGGQGGSGGGHTIQDSENSNLPQRGILKFAEGFQVSDDLTNGKTVVSCVAGTKNVAGYVGEISLFADNQLRENHVWADGSTINPATWPDLAAYAATAGWETDSGTGWYKTPNLQGCFLLPSSAEHAVNTTGGEATHTLTVDEMPTHAHAYQNPLLAFTSDPPSGQSTVHLSGTSSGAGWIGTDAIGKQATASTGGGQAHNNMPPYYVVTAQIRAKVDIIEATAVEVNGNTLGGFEDGQLLVQEQGKLAGVNPTPALVGFSSANLSPQKGETVGSNYSKAFRFGRICFLSISLSLTSAPAAYSRTTVLLSGLPKAAVECGATCYSQEEGLSHYMQIGTDGVLKLFTNGKGFSQTNPFLWGGLTYLIADGN